MAQYTLVMTVDIPDTDDVKEEIQDIIIRTTTEFSYYDAQVEQYDTDTMKRVFKMLEIKEALDVE
tara:strand:+ start:99 stop:293 length:195 start_codon:yes stop_codon:yes gene_type:complete